VAATVLVATSLGVASWMRRDRQLRASPVALPVSAPAPPEGPADSDSEEPPPKPWSWRWAEQLQEDLRRDGEPHRSDQTDELFVTSPQEKRQAAAWLMKDDEVGISIAWSDMERATRKHGRDWSAVQELCGSVDAQQEHRCKDLLSDEEKVEGCRYLGKASFALQDFSETAEEFGPDVIPNQINRMKQMTAKLGLLNQLCEEPSR
jgi:hypothetical protein